MLVWEARAGRLMLFFTRVTLLEVRNIATRHIAMDALALLAIWLVQQALGVWPAIAEPPTLSSVNPSERLYQA